GSRACGRTGHAGGARERARRPHRGRRPRGGRCGRERAGCAREAGPSHGCGERTGARSVRDFDRGGGGRQGGAAGSAGADGPGAGGGPFAPCARARARGGPARATAAPSREADPARAAQGRAARRRGRTAGSIRAMRHALLGLILVGALSGAGGLAHAQGKGRSRSEREAQALYQKGLKAYNLADYDKAIEAFKAAYELSEAPRLLYNIAQAYRLKGDCPQALRFYKTFLREQPTASNRSSVEGLVAEMEKCAQAPAPKPPLTPAPTVEPKPEPVPMPVTPAPPPPSAPAPAVAPSAPAPIESPPAARPPMEPPHESDRGHTTRVVGLVTAGRGGALVGAPVYFRA